MAPPLFGCALCLGLGLSSGSTSAWSQIETSKGGQGSQRSTRGSRVCIISPKVQYGNYRALAVEICLEPPGSGKERAKDGARMSHPASCKPPVGWLAAHSRVLQLVLFLVARESSFLPIASAAQGKDKDSGQEEEEERLGARSSNKVHYH